MHLLKRYLPYFFAFSLLNLNDVENYYAQIIENSNSYIRIIVQSQNSEKLRFEVDGKDYIQSSTDVITIPKSASKNVYSIIVTSESGRAYLELRNNGNYKNIIVDELEYFIGYYLVSLSSNCSVIHGNLSKSITFMNYNKNIYLDNISYFKISMLPYFKISNFIDIKNIYSVLYVFVDEGTFINIPYNLVNYCFYLDINLNEDIYNMNLKKIYSYDKFHDQMYLSKNELTEEIIFPSNFNLKNISFLMAITIEDTNFLFPIEISLKTDLLSCVEITSGNGEIIYEKNYTLF